MEVIPGNEWFGSFICRLLLYSPGGEPSYRTETVTGAGEGTYDEALTNGI